MHHLSFSPISSLQAKEQDPCKIIDTLNQCVTSLPRDKLHKVVGIGVSGQMHGVVLWNTNAGLIWFGFPSLLLG